MIRVEVVLTETQMAAEFVRGFRQRSLPEKFFYWFPLSVQAWLNLCRDGEYRNFVRSRDLISQTGRAMAERLPSRLELVSLGSGQGDKDLDLLRAIRASGRDVAYRPVDSSQPLLEMACRGAAEEGFDTLGLKLDVEEESHWTALAPGERPRFYILLGNTLGAFDPPKLLRSLRAVARDEDFFLLDGEIFAPESIAGYDNPTNRRFAFAPLASVGIQEADGALRFETKSDPRFPGLYFFPKHFEPVRDLELTMAGEPVRLEKGSRVDMNLSYKYSRPGFETLLSDFGGLEMLQEHMSADGRFVMVLARPA